MTAYIKFNGTKFADVLGVSTSTLNQKLNGKGGNDTLFGGFGDDKINGGDGNDWIFGGGGNDTIDGGKGVDLAVYQGAFNEYVLTFAGLKGTVKDLISGRDGTDKVQNVEFLKFSDGLYDVVNDTFQFFNRAPIVAGPVTGTAIEDGAISALNALANASDPDGDTLSVVNLPSSLPAGVTYDAVSHSFTLDPANAAYQHLADGEPVTVTVNYAVSDGIATTADSVSWIVTGTNDAPVISASDAAISVTNFTTLDFPSSVGTMAIGINDAGEIVGQTTMTSGHYIGFTYDGVTYSSIAVAGATNTSADAINDSGVIAGYYEPFSSTPRYGFIDTGGVYSLNVSLSPNISTTIDGINNAGVFVGSSFANGGHFYSGYIDAGGAVTLLNVSGSNDTHATGINNQSDVVGYYNDVAGTGNTGHGFLYHGGTFTVLNDPLGANGTYAAAINDAGQIVGWYNDAANKAHGFVYAAGVFTTIDDPLGTNGTYLFGLNDVGQLVGRYIDAGGVQHGFVAPFALLNSVAEDAQGHESGDETTSGTVAFGDVDLSDTHLVSAAFKTSDYSGGQLGSLVAVKTADTTGSGTGGLATWTFTASDVALDRLAQGQTVHETYTVTVDDQHGGLAKHDVVISIAGSNDAPVLQSLVGTGMDRTETSLALSGVMAFGDVDLLDTHAVTITPQGEGYVGDPSWTLLDSTGTGQGAVNLSYHLTRDQVGLVFPNGEIPDHYHQDYLISIDDGHGGTSSQLVSIPLADILHDGGGGGGPSGDNPPLFSFSGGDILPNPVFDDPSAATSTVNGILDFDDPDANDTHQVELVSQSGNLGTLGWELLDTLPAGGHGQIDWSYSVDEMAIRHLAAGESFIDHFTFKLFDSSGNETDKDISITIFGTDEAPIVQGPSQIFIEDTAGGLIDRAGNFIFSDADISDTHHLDYFRVSQDTFGGVFALNGDFNAPHLHDTTNGTGGEVQWTYDVQNDALRYLGEGESVSETWAVVIYGNNDALTALGVPNNGQGQSTTEYITFTIDGVNDAPHFNTDPLSINESPFLGSDFEVHREGNIGFGDFDINDTHSAFAAFDAADSSVEGEIGHLSAYVQGDSTGGIDVNGIVHWQYDLDTTAFGNSTTPIHQVYNIVLQDNHGGQTTQAFNIELFPHV
jgi:VCBS repeat-containing protein/probable HAF family extracellular repeat protein